MSWPSATDYRDALQHPDRALKDSRLKAGKVEVNRMGVPRARSGAFANVYKLQNGASTTAVRVFLYPNQERQERYEIVNKYLGQGRPGCLVAFAYDAAGIRVGGAWFPLLTLDWVNGITLAEWVRTVVEQRDSARILAMADQWIALVQSLKDSKIAHGDLQHGNVMVVKDSPVLVDYDCMCVPALVGRDAFERGLPAYQHPFRGRQKLSLGLDDFSAWIILIALRALARDLKLWQKYVERSGNENLLFTEADIQKPERSSLWTDLLSSDDVEVRAWAKQLRETLPNGKFGSIPQFDVNPFTPLAKACSADKKDWQTIVQLASDPKLAGKVLPKDLDQTVKEGKRRIDCRTRLQAAVQANRIRDIAAAHDSCLDDWPTCTTIVQRAREAKALVPMLDDLDAALKNIGDGRKFISLWDRHSGKLVGVPEADVFRKAAKEWTSKIAACETFVTAVQQDTEEETIASSWQRLSNAGGHPDAKRHEARAALAQKRVDCLRKLQSIKEEANEKNDQAFVRAWNQGILKECREADRLRRRLEDARNRLHLLEALQRVTKEADQGLVGEDVVLAASSKLPPQYADRLAPRLETAQTRLEFEADLSKALAATQPSDIVIAEAWERAKKAGTVSRGAELIKRCQLAIRRRDCLMKVTSTSSSLPLDEQDLTWLQHWDEKLLQECYDAEPNRHRYQQAKMRVAAWRDVEKALSKNDLMSIRSLANNRLLDGYPPLSRRQNEINELINRADKYTSTIELLSAVNGSEFVDGVDLKFLRDNQELFRAQRSQIESLLKAWLENEARINASDPAYVVSEEGTAVTVRWTWRYFGRISSCRVATDSAEFPRNLERTVEVDAEDHRRANGGAVIRIPPGTRRLFVTVWPTINIGWTELVGDPLDIGPILVGRRKHNQDSKTSKSWWRNIADNL